MFIHGCSNTFISIRLLLHFYFINCSLFFFVYSVRSNRGLSPRATIQWERQQDTSLKFHLISSRSSLNNVWRFFAVTVTVHALRHVVTISKSYIFTCNFGPWFNMMFHWSYYILFVIFNTIIYMISVILFLIYNNNYGLLFHYLISEYDLENCKTNFFVLINNYQKTAIKGMNASFTWKCHLLQSIYPKNVNF